MIYIGEIGTKISGESKQIIKRNLSISLHVCINEEKKFHIEQVIISESAVAVSM